MMTFAEWQESRGIRPWTDVHAWDEAAYQIRLFAAGLDRMIRRAFDPFIAAMGTIARTVDRVVEALEARCWDGIYIDNVTNPPIPYRSESYVPEWPQ